MNCLWNKPNQKISEIVIALSEKKAWDKHTVITLLNRMEKKAVENAGGDIPNETGDDPVRTSD